jgi:hypothetical protein
VLAGACSGRSFFKLDGAMMDQDRFYEFVTELAEPFWLKDSMKQGEFFDANGFARALLSASKPAAPMGWQLVPTMHEGRAGLTDGMMRAFYDAFEDNSQRGSFEQLNVAYNAMLAASPAAPAKSGEPVEADVVPNEIAELLTEPCWNLSRRDVSDLLKRIGSILYAAPQPSQPVEAGEPVGKNALTLTGAQLLEALDFIAPDRSTDAEQLESEVAIEYGEGHSGKAMYCWCAEYPEEGSWVLDGKSIDAAPQPSQPTESVGDYIDETSASYLAGFSNGWDKGRARVQSAVVLDDERAAFEAWMRGCEGYPYAGQYANLMWKAWQARAASPQATAFEWPPLPALPNQGFYAFDQALFTEHQMQGYANAYGEAVRVAMATATQPASGADHAD